jgi:hypothetical protein
MGYEGLAALRDFVEAGGTLIADGSAVNLPIDFGLVRGVSIAADARPVQPGLDRAWPRREPRAHPIAYGYDDEMPVFDRFGPYFSVPDRMTEASCCATRPPTAST